MRSNEFTDISYNWIRYWRVEGATYEYDELGFPMFRKSNFKQWQSKIDGSTLRELDEIACLILLGEPGSGKSTEIEKVDHKESLKLKYSFSKDSSASELFRGITSDATFKKWTKSKQRLYLYLDALDEALISIVTIRDAIVDWLKLNKSKYNIGLEHDRKLFLRIVCRSAVWNQKMTDDLKSIFGEDNLHIYELGPLTRDDIIIAAKNHNIDEDDFIDSISRNDLGTFTAEPVSIKFLIRSYLENKLR